MAIKAICVEKGKLMADSDERVKGLSHDENVF